MPQSHRAVELAVGNQLACLDQELVNALNGEQWGVIVQDHLFESDFDRVIKQIEAGGK